MNVVGFNGSPRPSGGTAWALARVLEGAANCGANTRLFRSGELDIRPCVACGGCAKGEGCAARNDMRLIYPALKAADALVLGMPIYMGQMSGQAKVFTDRLYACFKPRFSPSFREEFAGKKLILVWTQGNPDADKFKPYLDYTRAMFTTLEFDVLDVVVVAGTRSEAASEQAGLKERLIEAGAKLAEGEGK